jgi:aryl-alcohol dehydrogenase-like predicted oxidoreductase
MSRISRRTLLGASLVGGSAWLLGSRLRGSQANDIPATLAPTRVAASIKNATDKVALGKSGVKVSLVGIGTGSIGSGGSSNQTRLGQSSFTQLMRHAHDKGITLFDLADQYGSNPYFEKAMQGVSRATYSIQTKTNSRDFDSVSKDIDRFLRELNTDHIDSLILHCVTEDDWPTRFAGALEAMEKAKQTGKIRAHGVTCHSFEALQAAAKSPWVDINMVRWNSQRAHMDARVETVRPLFSQMRLQGQGMIGMKVVGQGDILRRQQKTPEECFRFQIESGVVDAFVVGVESVEQIDQLLKGTQQALDEVGYRVIAT